ncbi:uncharacterized protein TM35_000142900 [Trypanosoma theileri]|uniref:Uncharacterized protein n=1 Tax=Trypanosoma theileri TaxID=67003 RepID=A0A1X0NXX9_9TRYP|nr:uncharacterized protein TM35_000142900 [Trypanosoma theileri]ORC89079.1 hypothetical protein TM35_000142900 [Trypanosoma theileri]
MFGLEGHTATLYGEWIVVIGGKTSAFDLNGSVFTLNITTGEWKKLHCDGEPPPPRVYHSACLHGTRILIFGGITSVGFHNSHCNTCRTYTATQLEKDCKQQQQQQQQQQVEEEQRGIVLPHLNVSPGVVHALDFSTIPPRWDHYIHTTGTPPTHQPAHHAVAAHTTAMYVLGGCSVNGANLHTEQELGCMYRFDFSTRHWSVVPLQTPLFCWGATLTPLGGPLFCLFGGVSRITNRESRETFLLNVETGIVQHIVVNEYTPLPRVGHGAWRWGCFVYIFGGTGSNTRRLFNDLHRFDVPRRCWEPVVVTNDSTSSSISSSISLSLPPPLTGFAVVCVGEHVYIIGGLRSKMIRTMDAFRLNMRTLTWSKVEATFSNSQFLFSSLSSPFTDVVLFGSKRNVTRGVQTEFEGFDYSSSYSTNPVSTTTTTTTTTTAVDSNRSKLFEPNIITSNSKVNVQKRHHSDLLPHQRLDKEIKELQVLMSEWSKMITYKHTDDKRFILE